MCVRTLPSSNPALNLIGHELIPPNATPAQTLHSKMNPTTNQTHSNGLIPKCHAHKYTRTNARDDVDVFTIVTTCKLGGRKDEPTVGRKDNPPARKGKDRKKKDKKKKPKKPATPPDPSTEPSSEPSIDPSTAAPE